jgi:hypothetical protein
MMRSAVDVLLDPGAAKEAIDCAAEQLYDSLASAAALPTSEAIALPCGMAIAPADAARCTKDGLRTAMFLRGVLAAIQEAKLRFPGECIEVVYAGTGPYAPLAVPLMPRFAPGEARFTLLDIHQSTVESLRAVIDYFGIAPLVRAVIRADATAHQHPAPFHVLICETMQRALTVEPQVAITRHLAPQLHEQGIVVPQRIGVDLFVGKRVGCAVELTLDTARDAQYWSQPRVLRIPAHGPASLRTTITTFGPHELREYDSGLTHPEMLWDLVNAEDVECWYESGARPRVRVVAAPSH